MKRLRNVGSVLDKDFSFIYHRNIICQCSRVSAAFISPYVFKSILNDSTIDSFIIDSFEFNQEEIEQIPTIMNSLIQKGKIEISNDSKYQQTIELIHKIAESLGNDEILNQIYIKSSYYEGISLSEAIQKLHNYSTNFSPSNENYEKLISFISSKFHECMNECFDILNEDHLYEILSHPNLKIDDEDSLFECIIQNEKFHHLLEFIAFENLHTSNLEKYFDLLYPNNINLKMWQQICNFCIQANKSSKYKGTLIENEGDPFDGIFQYLTRICNGNPHCNRIINITESTHCCGNIYDVITKGNTNSYDNNRSDTNSFWQVDFKSNVVCLTGYSLKSQRFINNGQMINWSIVGSNDGIQWNVLDQKNNTQELNVAFHSHYWTIKNDNPEYYQYIRLKGTDQTTNSEWKSLRFSEIEFFGYIFNTNNNLTHQ